MYAYPTTLDFEAISICSKALKGELNIETAHAAWSLAGYALRQFDSHEPVKGFATKRLTTDAAIAVLDALPAAHKCSSVGMAETGIDWRQVLAIAMMVLEMLVEKST